MSVDACADLVARGDPDRFRSVLAAPPAARGRLLVLYAFNVEVSRAPWVTAEPLIAGMRLQWWADALAEIGAGKGARTHEVVSPLAQVIRAHGLPVALFTDLIAARRSDIGREPPADGAALDGYLEATSGNLMWLAALALGADPGAEAVVRDFAHAAGLAAYLRAVPALTAAGRQPLPSGPAGDVVALARGGLARLAAARVARRRVARRAAPALLAGWRAEATLRAAAAAPERVFAGDLEQSPYRRRFTLAWRGVTGRW